MYYKLAVQVVKIMLEMFAPYKILFCGSWWRAKNALEFNIVDSNAHCILEKSVIAKSFTLLRAFPHLTQRCKLLERKIFIGKAFLALKSE